MSNADGEHDLTESRVLFPSRMVFPREPFEIRLPI